MPPRKRGEGQMTWQAMLRLPDKAGSIVDEYAERWGVERAVAARVLLMEHIREIEEGRASVPDHLGQDQPR